MRSGIDVQAKRRADYRSADGADARGRGAIRTGRRCETRQNSIGTNMALFQESVNTQAYAKLGILGFAAAGKTFTGTRIAIGLIQLMQSRGLELANKPAMFLD